jgi:hypothetical protein
VDVLCRTSSYHREREATFEPDGNTFDLGPPSSGETAITDVVKSAIAGNPHDVDTSVRTGGDGRLAPLA